MKVVEHIIHSQRKSPSFYTNIFIYHILDTNTEPVELKINGQPKESKQKNNNNNTNERNKVTINGMSSDRNE